MSHHDHRMFEPYQEATNNTTQPAQAAAFPDMATLQAQFAAMQAEIQRLTGLVAQQATVDPAPAAAPVAFAAPIDQRRPHPRLPDVALFSGKRLDYLVWSLAARSKLLHDGDSIGGNAEKYAYLFARIEPAVQNLIAARYQSGLATADPDALFAHLDQVFVDPNAQDRALGRLQALRQREGESFAVFLPHFERLLHEAGLTDHRASISMLRQSLVPHLRRGLAYVNPLPTNYPSFTVLLFSVSSQLEEVEMSERSSTVMRPRQIDHIATPRQATPEPISWESTDPIRTNALAPLTTRERERLRMSGGYFRCRQPGHRANQCPEGTSPRSTTRPRTNYPVVIRLADPLYADPDVVDIDEVNQGNGRL